MATTADMIETHLTWMRAGTYANSTVDGARKILYRLDQELPAGLAESTGDELAAWLDRDGWADETRATYYKHIVRLYRWATDEDDPWLSYNPATRLRRPNPEPGLPRPAEMPVVKACIFDTADPWRLACRLAALAGLRPFEIARLDRSHVTREVIAVIRGKGRRSRAVPTVPRVWELVEPMPPGPLFVPTRRAKPADGKWVSRMVNEYLQSVGIPTTLYPLRHFYATMINERYRDVRAVQELLGHASLQHTMRYTQVTASRLQEAVTVLPFSGLGEDGTAGRERETAGAAAPRPPRLPVAGGRAVAHRALRRQAPARRH
ncbi:tyrosine-type recombinase/integrase [Rhizomonospora bruguierae]|uniref:tyrosine-type recombinase/integrase n=1 Tax=Rhizomonospora bruguierae TaxID=1581705 RepID=UPI001BD0D47C|nr:tyrosine-type recombinase/integrase [Micromonospora sp. NBRC 107566]